MDHLVATVDQLSGHLKAMRKARGLTQAQLGSLLGVGQVRIAEIEADPGSVSVAQMHKLLAALGVQISLREKSSGWQLPVSASVDQARAGEGKTPKRTKPAAGGVLKRSASKPGPFRLDVSKKRGSW